MPLARQFVPIIVQLEGHQMTETYGPGELVKVGSRTRPPASASGCGSVRYAAGSELAVSYAQIRDHKKPSEFTKN